MYQGLVLARIFGTPTLTRLNFMGPGMHGALRARRWLANESDHVVAESRAVGRWAAKACGLPETQVPVLESGVDVARFAGPTAAVREAMRATLEIEPGAAVLGLVGRLDLAEKGQEIMLRALPTVLEKHPRSVLLVVGDGPDRRRCGELVGTLGLGAAVRFLGQREDVQDVLAATDLVVVPSLCEEGFPFIAMEAQAAGRPVVASRSGGLPEAVIDQVTGIIVPKGDAASLATAIFRLLDDPVFARRLGDNGRVRTRSSTWERHVEELTRLYEQIAAEAR